MSVYIFTGPSLSADAACQALPSATYLPPVSQGDVYRVALKQPKVIGIIDGYFEHVPAVWHKEILWAMSQGIHVFGSSSMGALRAAELAQFGMIGVGKIFEAYHNLELEDDDEVAVAHTSAEEGYTPLSTAMVDIRETFRKAVADGVINQNSHDMLLTIAKNLFYPQRVYPTILQLGINHGVSLSEIEVLEQWLPINRVDQKRLDAIEMLRIIRDYLGKNLEAKKVTYHFENTDMWDRAVRYAGELYLDDDTAEAIFLEELLDEVRLVGQHVYQSAQQGGLSRFLGLIEARWQAVTVTADVLEGAIARFRRRKQLDNEATFNQWLVDNNLNPQQFRQLMEDEARLEWVYTLAEPDIAQNLPNYLRITGQYTRFMARAREKHRMLDANGLQNPGLMEVGLTENDLWGWYFSEKLNSDVPSDLRYYARSLGYENEQAFQRAVLREYCYVKHQQKGQ